MVDKKIKRNKNKMKSCTHIVLSVIEHFKQFKCTKQQLWQK